MDTYAQIQAIIDRLIGHIGSEKLLMHLNDFEKNYNYSSDDRIKKLKKAVLDHYKLNEKKLHDKTNDATNARRIITWYLIEETNFSATQIMEIMDITKNTYNNYMSYMVNLFSNTAINPEFFEDIVLINFKLNN